MHWKLKATIQNAISLIPSSASYSIYYWIQRHFGGLRQFHPVSRLSAGIETWRLIEKLGEDPKGKVFFEVGTGRVPLAALAYWLMGAKKIITIDLNPYLKAELIEESLCYIANNKGEILRQFGSLIQENRLNKVLNLSRGASFSTGEFLDLCCISYIAPGDAGNTKLLYGSIDYHTSYTVFEHIPPTSLKKIIDEGNRIIKANGLFIHRIDYTDHFSHADKSISAINFLQFSEKEWERYAGNRYMYMNRMRHDDYIRLFQSSGHKILAELPDGDSSARELLRNGSFQLSERFKGKSPDLLSISGSWIVSQKDHNEGVFA